MPEIRSVGKSRSLFLGGLVGLLLFTGCAGSYQPQVASRQLQLLTCFDSKYSQGEKPACCEPSAGVQDGAYLLMASDKPVPEGTSSILMVDEKGQVAGTLDNPVINRMAKIEAMSRTTDQAWTVASSAFSYYIPEQAKYNRHNMLVAWPAGKPQEAQLLFPSLVDGEESSIGLNQAIRQALISDKWPKGPPYFKIEGMTLTPDHKILLGVREQGAAYEDFDYSRTILAMDYQIVEGHFQVSGHFQRLVDLQVPTMSGMAGYPALSDLAFDEKHNNLYVLTSFEGGAEPCNWSATESHLCGLLYYIPYNKISAGQLLSVTEENGEVVRFARKSEGLVITGKNQLVIIYDDDRDLGVEGAPRREMNQSFYEVLQLK